MHHVDGISSFFGLERDPFLDTADPFFYCEFGALRKAKERLYDAVDASRGLTVISWATRAPVRPASSAHSSRSSWPTTGLCLGRFSTRRLPPRVEFFIAIGRVFGLALPPRSSAALKNALEELLLRNGRSRKTHLVLTIDEAQNLSDENLEALRLLLNYHVPAAQTAQHLALWAGRAGRPHSRAKGNLGTASTGGFGCNASMRAWPLRCWISALRRRGCSPTSALYPGCTRAPDRGRKRPPAPSHDGCPRGHAERPSDRASTLVNEGDRVRSPRLPFVALLRARQPCRSRYAPKAGSLRPLHRRSRNSRPEASSAVCSRAARRHESRTRFSIQRRYAPAGVAAFLAGLVAPRARGLGNAVCRRLSAGY